MRGKLRDKHSTAKRDISKREGLERRRPNKRDNRSMVRFNLQTEDNDFEFDIEEVEYKDEEKVEVPGKK